MTRALPLLSLIAAALLIGCETVSTPAPIGQPVTAALEPTIDGTWRHKEHVVHIKDLGQGELRAAIVGWKDGQFQIEQHDFTLTTDDEALYLNMAGDDQDQSEQRRYQFIRLMRPDDDSLVLLMPRASVFRTAVENDKLPGTIEQRDHARHVRLEDMDAINRFIAPTRAGEQFDLEKPLVLHRIGPLPDDDEPTAAPAQ